MSYETESKSRNADFILIARKVDTTTLGAKGPVKLMNPWAEGPSILRTFPFTTLGAKPRQPSPLTPLPLLNPDATGFSSIELKKFFSSFQKWETPVIYIVEGHEKPAVLPDLTPYVSQLAIRNDSME